ncbi:hypothetical protein [Helicobacter salomonis]|uniref:hypothetical protein n=1 Tax=Helicobacter salomonis TaxID=56878 RepID=UPI000CF0DBDF|nr:hypothetical protein [Helicobacter salomonis]
MTIKWSWILVPLLSGCLNLNLKQTLPEISYYDLNTQEIPSVCANPKSLALIGVLGADLVNTKDILLKRANGQIERSVKEKFADLPANMLKNMLTLEAMRQCVILSVPPNSAHVSLKLNVLFLGIVEHEGAYSAQIVLSADMNNQSFMALESQKVSLTSKDKELDIPPEALQALQQISAQAIAKIITQVKANL